MVTSHRCSREAGWCAGCEVEAVAMLICLVYWYRERVLADGMYWRGHDAGVLTACMMVTEAQLSPERVFKDALPSAEPLRSLLINVATMAINVGCLKAELEGKR